MKFFNFSSQAKSIKFFGSFMVSLACTLATMFMTVPMAGKSFADICLIATYPIAATVLIATISASSSVSVIDAVKKGSTAICAGTIITSIAFALIHICNRGFY